MYSCKSTVFGWVTINNLTGEEIGPEFRSCTDLWAWQKANLYNK